MNQVSVNGLEWGSVLLIAARPGIGKSLMKDQLVRECIRLNPEQKFRNLAFEWEMPLLVSNIREMSSHIGRTYQYMCSVESQDGEVLTPEEIKQCVKYFRKKAIETKNDQGKSTWDTRIDVVTTRMSPEEFKQTCLEYAQAYPDDNILVTIDHIRLGLRGSKSENEILGAFGEVMIDLKMSTRSNKFIFVPLTHLNRKIEEAERCKEGTVGNYITDADIFGADAMAQCADIIFALDCPAQRNIHYYGENKLIIDDERVLVGRYLKVRNGSKITVFMRGMYERMELVETKTPPKKVMATPKITVEKSKQQNNELFLNQGNGSTNG